MPRRAIISAVFVLIGTLTGSAAQLNRAVRNAPFQPRSSLHPAVILPRQVGILGAEQRLFGIKIQKINPLLQAPAIVRLTRTAVVNRSSGAKPQPGAVKAAGSHRAP